MQFTGRTPSVNDEDTKGVDSSAPTSTFSIDATTFVSGGFQDDDDFDYYQLDLAAGKYVLYTSTEGVNTPSVSSAAITISLVDKNGTIVDNADLFHIDTFTDQISFTYDGDQELYLKVTSNLLTDFNYSAAIYAGEPAQPEPTGTTEWRLFAPDNFEGEIGGNGVVNGTAGYQHISVLDQPGKVTFDPSFNRGGDIVELAGDAGDWTIIRSGSNAVLSDGDTTVTIPVGTTGLAVSFDDGARTLRFDSAAESFKIGAQSFGNVAAQISAPADGTALPDGGPVDSSVAKLYLVAEGDVAIGSESKVEVFGTSEAEIVTVTGGEIQFDASFNRGGDTIVLDELAAGYTATRVGSSVRLDDGGDTQVLIPVGTFGLTIAFGDNDERELLFDPEANGIVLGDQLITTTPAALTDFA